MELLPEIAAGITFASLVLYVLTAGADFGGGAWSFIARLRGEYITAEQAEKAIAPIWEANHIWMIVALVMLFICFPAVFAEISTIFHIPLVLALVGIVLRGSAYAFGAYGLGDRAETTTWQRIFGASSLLTPFFLGLVVGGIATGHIFEPSGNFTFAEVYVDPWLHIFPVICGLFAMNLFSHLAAVYLTVDSQTESAKEMYRIYGIFSGITLGFLAFLSWQAIPHSYSGSRLLEGLFQSSWSLPLHIATGIAALVCIWSLFRWRFRRARIAVIVQTVLIMTGWGLSQYPYLIPGRHTVQDAAAEPAVLAWTVGVLGVGSLFLAPAFFFLFKLFKFQPSE